MTFVIVKYEEVKDCLIQLLKSNLSLPDSDVCIAEIRNGNLVDKYADLRLGTVDRIKRIYSIRAKLVKEGNSPVYGMDQLVDNLEKTDRTYVRIHVIEADEFNYYLFTDDENEVLFGIVAVDESTNSRRQ